MRRLLLFAAITALVSGGKRTEEGREREDQMSIGSYAVSSGSSIHGRESVRDGNHSDYLPSPLSTTSMKQRGALEGFDPNDRVLSPALTEGSYISRSASRTSHHRQHGAGSVTGDSNYRNRMIPSGKHSRSQSVTSSDVGRDRFSPQIGQNGYVAADGTHELLQNNGQHFYSASASNHSIASTERGIRQNPRSNSPSPSNYSVVSRPDESRSVAGSSFEPLSLPAGSIRSVSTTGTNTRQHKMDLLYRSEAPSSVAGMGKDSRPASRNSSVSTIERKNPQPSDYRTMMRQQRKRSEAGSVFSQASRGRSSVPPSVGAPGSSHAVGSNQYGQKGSDYVSEVSSIHGPVSETGTESSRNSRTPRNVSGSVTGGSLQFGRSNSIVSQLTVPYQDSYTGSGSRRVSRVNNETQNMLFDAPPPISHSQRDQIQFDEHRMHHVQEKIGNWMDSQSDAAETITERLAVTKDNGRSESGRDKVGRKERKKKSDDGRKSSSGRRSEQADRESRRSSSQNAAVPSLKRFAGRWRNVNANQSPSILEKLIFEKIRLTFIEIEVSSNNRLSYASNYGIQNILKLKPKTEKSTAGSNKMAVLYYSYDVRTDKSNTENVSIKFTYHLEIEKKHVFTMYQKLSLLETEDQSKILVVTFSFERNPISFTLKFEPDGEPRELRKIELQQSSNKIVEFIDGLMSYRQFLMSL